MHIISASQFSHDQLDAIFSRADFFKKQLSQSSKQKLTERHKGRLMCSLFFQPSTRTRLSFEAAAAKLGLAGVSTENAREHSSSAKGETLEDTIKNINGYDFDLIVMRHHEAGAAARAAKVSQTPIINAGDGTGEHPTQALLDAYTIKQAYKRLNKLTIVMGGDLLHGRTIHSLTQLLSKFKANQFIFVSVPQLQISDDIKGILKKSKTKFTQTDNLKKALKDADVIYWTRLQKEYIKDPKAIPKGGFVLDKKTLTTLPKKAIIMHPLPRVDEIHPDVDDDPRAYYFKQAANGLYIRMALIDLLLSAKL